MSQVLSLQKAFDILDELSRHAGGITLGELSSRLEYPKSTVHALLSTMRDRGVVKQLPSGAYDLGIKLFEYGCVVSRGFDISRISKPYLERLSLKTGCGAVISTIDDAGVVSFDHASAPSGVQIMPELGVRLPLHCTSQGKLMLSLLSDSTATMLLCERSLTAYTPHSKVDLSDVIAELSVTRERGYAVEDGEYRIGLRSVSAPVRDSSGTVRYALTAIGFLSRTGSEEFRYAVEATLTEAQRLSDALNSF